MSLQVIDVGIYVSKGKNHRGYAIAVFVKRRVFLEVGLVLLRFLARQVSHLVGEVVEKPVVMNNGRTWSDLDIKRWYRPWRRTLWRFNLDTHPW